MILALNIGNTHILLGVWQQDQLLFRATLSAETSRSTDEYAIQLLSLFSLHGLRPDQLEGAILSSVVPSLTARLRQAVQQLCQLRVMTVGPGLKTGLQMHMDDPAQLGGELVCCAVAARALGPLPCVAVLMDTAISMVALDKNGVLCGGAILPGVRTGYDALCERTAQLTQIELRAPACGVLGTNSVACMQAGAVFGTASMLDGMLERFSLALNGEAACVATGAFAPVALPHCRHAVRYEEHLVLDGLRLLYEKNAR